MQHSLFIFALFVVACSAGITYYDVGLVPKTVAHPFFGKGHENGFTIDGVEAPLLVLLKGEKYVFKLNGTIGALDFYITSSIVGGFGGQLPYTVGVNGTGFNGTRLFFTPADDAPAELYYHAKQANYVGYLLRIVDNLCDAGFYRPAGAKGNCLRCLAGMYSDPYATQCKPCPVGTYSTGRGNTSCVLCPAGTFSPGGSAVCQPCPPGKFSGNGSPACEPCPPGTFSDVDGSTACTACDAGFKSCAGATSCSACPVGTISSSLGFACRNCDAGTYNDLVGNYFCSPCPPDFYSGNGASACTPCPPDTWSLTGTNTAAGCFPMTFKK